MNNKGAENIKMSQVYAYMQQEWYSVYFIDWLRFNIQVLGLKKKFVSGNPTLSAQKGPTLIFFFAF